MIFTFIIDACVARIGGGEGVRADAVPKGRHPQQSRRVLAGGHTLRPYDAVRRLRVPEEDHFLNRPHTISSQSQ